MTTQRDIRQLQEKAFARKEDTQRRIRATLVSVGGSVNVPNKKWYVWYVRTGSTTPAEIFNMNVQARAGMPVIIGKEVGSTILEVLHKDTAALVDDRDFRTPGLPAHGDDQRRSHSRCTPDHSGLVR